MYEFNCCFAEAVIGVANEYEIAPEEIGTKKPIRCPITRNELAEIGLCHYNRKPESYPIGFVDREYKKSGYRIYRETFCRNPYAVEREEIEYLYIVQKGKSQMEHINNLFEQDREAFKFLLTKKAEDAEKTYTQNYLFLRTISDVLGEKGVTSYLTDTMMYMSLHGIYTARKILATLKRL